jgi:hypothetical protein
MKKIILPLLISFYVLNTQAQSLAINNDGSTANSSSILDVKVPLKAYSFQE